MPRDLGDVDGDEQNADWLRDLNNDPALRPGGEVPPVRPEVEPDA